MVINLFKRIYINQYFISVLLENYCFVFLWFLFSEAVAQRCSVKKLFLEISRNSQENTSARVSFLIKLLKKRLYFIKKETLTQVFSCEFCEISKNTFSYRTPPMTASVCFCLLCVLNLMSSL